MLANCRYFAFNSVTLRTAVPEMLLLCFKLHFELRRNIFAATEVKLKIHNAISTSKPRTTKSLN